MKKKKKVNINYKYKKTTVFYFELQTDFTYDLSLIYIVQKAQKKAISCLFCFINYSE